MAQMTKRAPQADDGAAGDLLDLMARPSWHAAAACRDAHSTIFFPEPGASTWRAKTICARCPVLEPCRDWALAQGVGLVGIWGGMTPRERATAASRR
jgi:WhiB family redox-sensing transcriptional regulator